MKWFIEHRLKLSLIPLLAVVIIWGLVLPAGLNMIKGFRLTGDYTTWRFAVAYLFLLGPFIGGLVGIGIILRKLEKSGDFILFKDPLRSIIEYEHKREERDKSIEESFKHLYEEKD